MDFPSLNHPATGVPPFIGEKKTFEPCCSPGLPHEDHDELPAAPSVVWTIFEIQIPRVVDVGLG